MIVKYDGKEYPIKKYNGYLFATETLFNELINEGDEFKNQDAENIDNSIAFYFEKDEFHSNNPKQLFKIWNRHS